MTDRAQAEFLFAKVFFTAQMRWGMVTALASDVERGLRAIEPELIDEAKASAQWFGELGEAEGVFIDREAVISALGGLDRIATKTHELRIQRHNEFQKAAGLVFMHSMLDAAASDLLRTCALVARDDWAPLVESKTVTFGNAQTKTADQILRELVEVRLAELEHEPLIKRLDRLHALCRPEPGTRLESGYVYSRSRVEQLDEARHKIVHGDGPILGGAISDEDIRFLFDTVIYASIIVSRRYGLKADPNLVIHLLQT
jgi:hypothetical protein